MPSDVPLPSMSIARASAGGLVQSIFSSPSRIATCGQVDLYCRHAKLKMLCIIELHNSLSYIVILDPHNCSSSTDYRISYNPISEELPWKPLNWGKTVKSLSPAQ